MQTLVNLGHNDCIPCCF